MTEKRKPPSIVTPTNRELAWWLVGRFFEKLFKLALLAAAVYGLWWWWGHR